MKTLLQAVAVVVSVFLLIGLGLYTFGYLLPERHSETMTVELAARPEKVWAVLTDYSSMPKWWGMVLRSEEETRADGTHVTWQTDQRNQRIGFITTEEAPPRKLVRKILDEGLPFGGGWIFELSPLGSERSDHTRLTLIEDGFVRPPLARAFVRLFMGQRSTMESFLSSLKERVKATESTAPHPK